MIMGDEAWKAAGVELVLIRRPRDGLFIHVTKEVALPQDLIVELTLTSGVEVELEVETRDRVPHIQSVTLRGGPISSGDLRLPLAEWLGAIVAQQARPVSFMDTDGWRVRTVTEGDTAPSDAATRAARGRTVTTDDLHAFVEAYKVGGIEGAADELFISDATAYRRLRKCRAQGLLPQKGED